MTLTEAKNEIAGRHDFDSWEQMDKAMSDPNNLFHPLNDYERWQELHGEAAKLYATEKVKEALKLSAERATLWVETPINGTEFEKIEEDLGDGFTQVYTVFKDSILRLETEILNQINKEI